MAFVCRCGFWRRGNFFRGEVLEVCNECLAPVVLANGGCKEAELSARFGVENGCSMIDG